MPFLSTTKDGPVLRVHVQPGAAKSEIVGIHGDALRVRVAVPPVSGRANRAVLELLASKLEVPRAALELIAGPRGRTKRVRVSGLDASELEGRLWTVLGSPPAR